MLRTLAIISNQIVLSFGVFDSFFYHQSNPRLKESSILSMAKQMEAHFHEEQKLWSFVVLCQKQIKNARRKNRERNLTSRNSRWEHQQDTFRALPGVHTYYISFRKLGSQEFNASNGVQIGAEMKKLWPFEDNRTKLSENFAVAKSACKNFEAAKPPASTRVPLCNSNSIFASHLVKSTFSCEIDTSNLRNPPV